MRQAVFSKPGTMEKRENPCTAFYKKRK